jgi:hypothetical protein
MESQDQANRGRRDVNAVTYGERRMLKQIVAAVWVFGTGLFLTGVLLDTMARSHLSAPSVGPRVGGAHDRVARSTYLLHGDSG